MYLDLTSDQFDPLQVVRFASGNSVAWSDQLRMQNLADPRIFGVVFPDAAIVHPEFIARLCSQADPLPPTMHSAGGKKIRDAETWDMPAARLLLLRALMLFCRARNVPQAHVLDRWANVMQAGDYSTPHCHYDAEASIVYAVQPGEPIPGQPMDGEFELIDPRIPACCPYQPERPIRGLSPRFVPGLMLMFPAEFLHHVRPYSGASPRITLAWNISAGPPPSDRVIDPTKSVPFQMISARAT